MVRPPGLEPGTAGLEIYAGVICQVEPNAVRLRQVAQTKRVALEARELSRVGVEVRGGDFLALKWHTCERLRCSISEAAIDRKVVPDLEQPCI